MAKKCSIERNDKRKRMVKEYRGRRTKLKATIMDKETPQDVRFEAVMKLSRLNKNSARTRLRNRCELTGRPRGYHRKFGICRNMLRDMAQNGQLPGVIKSSW